MASAQIPIDEQSLRRLVELAQLGADAANETAQQTDRAALKARLLREVQWLYEMRAKLRAKGVANI